MILHGPKWKQMMAKNRLADIYQTDYRNQHKLF